MFLDQPLYGGGYFVAFTQAAAVYYLSAVLLHYVIPFLFPVKSIQKGNRTKGQVTREALTSLGPIAVKAAMWTFVEMLHSSHKSLVYSHPLFDSWPKNAAYYLFTIIALDYLHDTWFYWTHRFLHWSPIYTSVHFIHHKSVVPTAFTGYSFHIAEAMLVFANEILVCYLFPIHVGLHRIYHMFTTMIHIGGHAGYEIAPFIPSIEALLAGIAKIFHSLILQKIWRGARYDANKNTSKERRNRSKERRHTSALDNGVQLPIDALNTVQHHDMHHRYPTVHFSLYMTHWDWFCGTEHPKYRSEVKKHFNR